MLAWHGQINRPGYFEQLLVPIVELKQRLFRQQYLTTKTVLLISGEGRRRHGTTKILRDTYIMNAYISHANQYQLAASSHIV